MRHLAPVSVFVDPVVDVLLVSSEGRMEVQPGETSSRHKAREEQSQEFHVSSSRSSFRDPRTPAPFDVFRFSPPATQYSGFVLAGALSTER